LLDISNGLFGLNKGRLCPEKYRFRNYQQQRWQGAG
jgi:hypothetical protein